MVAQGAQQIVIVCRGRFPQDAVIGKLTVDATFCVCKRLCGMDNHIITEDLPAVT